MTTLAVVGAAFVAAPPAFGARPAGTQRCSVATVRDAGSGRVLGLYVQRAGCGGARRFVAAYQRCLDRRCYTRIRRRCVQPEFHGRCRTHDRFFQRTLRRYRCTERRAGLIRAATRRPSTACADAAASTTATRS